MVSVLVAILFIFAVGCSIHPKKVSTPYYVSSIEAAKDIKFLPRILPTKKQRERKGLNEDTELECKVRQLAYKYAQQIQPFRGTQKDTYDALNIDHYCGTHSKINRNIDMYNNHINYHSNIPLKNEDSIYTTYVDPINGNDNNNGSISSPFKSMYSALNYLRSFKSNEISKQIILRSGILFLNSTIDLSPLTFDNNLIIRSYPNESVTISGGVLLNNTNIIWKKYNDNNSQHNIWMTQIDQNIVDSLYNNTILSLFTLSPHTRLTRARYPNGHVEVWNNGKYYLSPNLVNKWWTPPNGTEFAPKQVYKDLSNCSNTKPCLNHSQFKPFDTYTAGYDNLCDLWTPSYSYWCGQNCSGGWGEQDRRMAMNGMRQLPIGMTYNTTALPEINKWGNDIETAIFHIAHSQGWNMFFWKAGDKALINTKYGNISLGLGGFQGGRVWTKTDDMGNKKHTTNIPIAGGKWYIDNVFSVLDAENEWFFDKNTNILYYWPNNTNIGKPPPSNIDLVIGNLSTLFSFSSNDMNNPLFNVSIQDINFRDTRYTYLDKWGTPSGGDWAFFNGGAFHLENTSNVSIMSSSFTRLDGNCITFYGYNRNGTVKNNLFQYIGDNVVGLWGKTNDYDGTDGQQPRYMYITGNYVHDIGLYQLQSSLHFQAKSCLNTIANNIVFDVPRAAVLFNDAFGGSNQVISNLLFNTCTQSGDHGPINSWNRMPFETNVAYGYPSYDSGYTNVSLNFIFANYGGSQGFDTDDGSAWYNMYNNFFYDALGYKNDYGGYNVNYYNNINVALSGNACNCWEIIPVDTCKNNMYSNKCIVYQCGNPSNCDVLIDIWPSSNKYSALQQYNNSYYTPHGNATVKIESNTYLNISDMQQKYNLSQNSTANFVPTVDEIVSWVSQLLNIT